MYKNAAVVMTHTCNTCRFRKLIALIEILKSFMYQIFKVIEKIKYFILLFPILLTIISSFASGDFTGRCLK